MTKAPIGAITDILTNNNNNKTNNNNKEIDKMTKTTNNNNNSNNKKATIKPTTKETDELLTHVEDLHKEALRERCIDVLMAANKRIKRGKASIKAATEQLTTLEDARVALCEAQVAGDEEKVDELIEVLSNPVTTL